MKKTILFGILPLFLMVTMFSCKEEESTLLKSEIAISNTTLEMNVGNTANISAKITQWLDEQRVKSNEDLSIKWESSNSEVVSVTGGKLTAVSGGTATIRAYSSTLDGVEATCEVTVHDIYVAGEIGIQHNNQNYKNIVVWKNGEIVDSLAISRANVMASGLAVVGNDIYVAGMVDGGSKNYVAKVWKNHEELYSQSSTGAAAMVTSLVVKGADVYYAGYDSVAAGNLVAKIWKNDAEYLSVDGGAITSLSVDGNDIYAAGYVESAGVKVAKIWKNGTVAATFSGNEDVVANAVFADGSGVYAAGYAVKDSKQVAKAWRNGAEFYTLTNGAVDAYATSICLNEGIVYVGGRDAQGDTYARAWQNGELFTLESKWGAKNIEAGSRCAAITASAGEVIAVGTTFNNSNNQTCAILWRDGKITKLELALETDGDLDNTKTQNRATCLFVK